MSHRCDVHVLYLERERADWREQCLNSLETEPVNVHLLPGIINGQGEARSKAFGLGDAEFVSFADPDDTVVSGAFEWCFNELDTRPDLSGVWTAQKYALQQHPHIILDDTEYNKPDWPRYAFDIHHLVVMRRTAIEPYLDELATWTGGCEKGLWIRMVDDGHQFGFIRKIGYLWRNRIDSARSWRTPCPIVRDIMHEHFQRTRLR